MKLIKDIDEKKLLEDYQFFKEFSIVYDQELLSLYKSYYKEDYKMLDAKYYYGEDLKSYKNLIRDDFITIFRSHFNKVELEKFYEIFRWFNHNILQRVNVHYTKLKPIPPKTTYYCQQYKQKLILDDYLQSYQKTL